MFREYLRWQSLRRYSMWPQRILLVRHGESDANVDRMIYAHTPDNKIGLSPKGVLQAQDVGRKLREIVGDESTVFIVSPYRRTRMTLTEIVKSFDPSQYSVREDPRVREQEWGNFQEAAKMEQRMKERREVGSFYYRFPEGESGADVYDRVSSFLETLFRQFDCGRIVKNLVIVTHGITMRLFLMRYFHWTVETFHDLWNPENCALVLLNRAEGEKKFRLATRLKSEHNLYLQSTKSAFLQQSGPSSVCRT
eukprot:m51a1_g2645 hypothetical protein (251) ;mRNA; r:607780-608835